MKINKLTITLLLFVIALGASIVIYNKVTERNRILSLRDEVVRALQSNNGCEKQRIELRPIFPMEYTEICFQPGYASKERFEIASGKKIENYEMWMYDGTYFWWLFDKDGHGTKLEMPQVRYEKTMRSDDDMCFPINNSYFSSTCRAGVRYLKIER